jgi:hypothetical protein
MILSKQKEFLNLIGFPSNGWTTRLISNGFEPWKIISQQNRRIDYRNVLQSEVVWDLDFKDWHLNRKWAIRIFNQIIETYDTNPIMEYTGGTGIHISLFFKIDKLNYWRLAQNKCNLNDIRNYLWNKILDKLNISNVIVYRNFPKSYRAPRSRGGVFDSSCIKISFGGKGRIITLPGTKKGKYYATAFGGYIPQERPKITNPEEIYLPNRVEFYKLKSCEVDNIISNKKLINDLKPKTSLKTKINNLDIYPCYKELLNGMEKGQRALGAQTLSIVLTMASVKTNSIMREYYNNCRPKYYTDRWWDWYQDKEPSRRFPKHMMEELGLCRFGCKKCQM